MMAEEHTMFERKVLSTETSDKELAKVTDMIIA
jgi:hypothetical protein